MKVTTIKQYENEYYVTFGYNGAQFGDADAKITKDITRTANSEAHDDFIKDTNRYSSIPTPRFEDCKFETIKIAYTEEESKYRIYTIKVKVTWQYIK